MPDTLSIALQSAASYRPPPPEGFEGGGIGTVPTGESWSLTAPYFFGIRRVSTYCCRLFSRIK